MAVDKRAIHKANEGSPCTHDLLRKPWAPKHAAIPAPSRLRREPPPTWGLGQKRTLAFDRHSRGSGHPASPTGLRSSHWNPASAGMTTTGSHFTPPPRPPPPPPRPHDIHLRPLRI